MSPKTNCHRQRYRAKSNRYYPWEQTFESLLDGLEQADLPARTALLGVCEDGLPFLLDLGNPAPGAILVAGDPGSGKTALLRSLLTSTWRIHQAGKVVFSVIASQPEEYTWLSSASNCQGVYPVEDLSLGERIFGMVEAVEMRKKGGSQEPAILLAIDDLANLLPFLDEETYHRLYWLIRHGPRYQVWIFAALSSAQVAGIAPRYLTAFRTTLFGHMQDEYLAHRLANDDTFSTRDLEQGNQFLLPYGSDWLPFWICEQDWGEAPHLLGQYGKGDRT